MIAFLVRSTVFTRLTSGGLCGGRHCLLLHTPPMKIRTNYITSIYFKTVVQSSLQPRRRPGYENRWGWAGVGAVFINPTICVGSAINRGFCGLCGLCGRHWLLHTLPMKIRNNPSMYITPITEIVPAYIPNLIYS